MSPSWWGSVHTDINIETQRVFFILFLYPPWDLVSVKCVFWQRKRRIHVDGRSKRTRQKMVSVWTGGYSPARRGYLSGTKWAGPPMPIVSIILGASSKLTLNPELRSQKVLWRTRTASSRRLLTLIPRLSSALWNAPFTCMGLPHFRW